MNWDNLEFTKPKKLVTGKTKVKVVGVNPNIEEIAAITGIPIDKINEPNYDDKIVVYVENTEGIQAKGTFWLKNEYVKVSSTGKTKYMNAYCQSAYLSNPEDDSELDWYSRTGLRKAKEGEDEIYKLFCNWLGIDTQAGKFELPFDKFVNGDISDFKEALKRFGDKEFVVLYGISNGKYQEFYTREFGRTFSKSFSKVQWNRDFTEEYQEYVPTPEPDALESGFKSEGIADDEIPF